MDENRFEGTARNVGGKVQEGLGRATGDVKTKTEGMINQAAGAAQDLYVSAWLNSVMTRRAMELRIWSTRRSSLLFQ
jgi:uncharacterized protein YjbJ (UPF0337 family)